MSQAAQMDVEIGELVLHGFAPGDRYRIGDAVARELERLVAEGGLTALDAIRDVTLETVDGGSFALTADARPEAVGGQIAEQVMHGMSAASASAP